MVTAMLYRVRVRHLNPKRVEVTLDPTWLGRLLRRPVRVGDALRAGSVDGEGRSGIGWFWKATDRWVGGHVERYIEVSPLIAIEDIPIEKLLDDD